MVKFSGEYMRIIIILIINISVVLLITSNSNASNQKPDSNFEIIDSLSLIAATEILHRLEQNREDSLIIRFAPNPAYWIVEQHILNEGRKVSKFFFTHQKDQVSKLSINIKKIDVDYDLLENRDSLSRKVLLIITYTLEKPNGILFGLPQIRLIHEDEVSRDDIPYLENSSYSFSKGIIPEREQTFFEKIAEPVIFISTAIITIALLFSVRSG